MIWLVPQGSQTKFVISNAGNELDALIERQKTIVDSDKEEFDKMLAGKINYDNYISIAEISSSQINSIIIEIIEGDVSAEWRSSYSSLADSLRSNNSYLRETIVIAEKLKLDSTADISQEKIKLEELRRQAEESLSASNSARP